MSTDINEEQTLEAIPQEAEPILSEATEASVPRPRARGKKASGNEQPAITDESPEMDEFPEMESEEPELEQPGRGRGRPPKNNTAKYSVYLPPDLYADLFELAKFSKRPLNDVFKNLATAYVEANRERLEYYRNVDIQAPAEKFPTF